MRDTSFLALASFYIALMGLGAFAAYGLLEGRRVVGFGAIAVAVLLTLGVGSRIFAW